MYIIIKVGWSLIWVVSVQGGLTGSLIRLVFHWGGLLSGWSLVTHLLHLKILSGCGLDSGCLPSGCSQNQIFQRHSCVCNWCLVACASVSVHAWLVFRFASGCQILLLQNVKVGLQIVFLSIQLKSAVVKDIPRLALKLPLVWICFLMLPNVFFWLLLVSWVGWTVSLPVKVSEMCVDSKVGVWPVLCTGTAWPGPRWWSFPLSNELCEWQIAHTHAHTHTHSRMHAHTHAHTMHEHTCMHTHIHPPAHTAHAHMCMHIHTHTCTHTHM